MAKKTTLGSRKTDTKKIGNAKALQVTFSKRRASLFKKASDLHTLCGAVTALIVFSPSGKPHSFGLPSFESVTNRFLGVNPTPDLAVVEEYRGKKLRELSRQYEKVLDELDAERKIAEECKEKLNAAQDLPWWERPIENIGLRELEMLHGSLQVLGKNIETEIFTRIHGGKPPCEPKMNPTNAFDAPRFESNPKPSRYPCGLGGTSHY